MTESTRYYRLAHKKTGELRLIEAGNPARAMMHVARSDWTIRVASTKDMAAMRKVPIEKAGEDLLVPEPGE